MPNAGNYYVWGRVLAINVYHDTFFTKANGGSEDVYDDAEGTWGPNWQWTIVNGRGPSGVPLSIDPRIFTFSAGANTIRFRGRDSGSEVDRILVTDDPNFVPTGGNVITFPDTPPSNPFFDFVETAGRNQITSGCGGGDYCPSAGVTRAQMAVFLLKSKYGASYTPPAPSGSMFHDVHTSTFAAGWIEKLATDGITTGCGNGNYCPNAIVTRAQMAVFLMRARHDPGYVPPPPVGLFADLGSDRPVHALDRGARERGRDRRLRQRQLLPERRRTPAARWRRSWSRPSDYSSSGRSGPSSTCPFFA